MPDATAEFLASLYGATLIPGGELWILIWSLPAKISHWFQDIDLAAECARQLAAQHEDVYVGVGLAPGNLGTRRRCPAQEIAGIPGLWADIDIQHEVHKKPGLAASIEDALVVCNDLAEPSIVIHSGHGIQAWWLFDTPWIFVDEQDRHRAQTLVGRWHQALVQAGAKRHIVVDPTQDLARVMRVPGTTNYKAAPVPVEIALADNGLRYAPAQLEAYLPLGVTSATSGVTASEPVRTTRLPDIDPASGMLRMPTSPHLRIDAGASPPGMKFHELIDLDIKFRATWQHERKDMRDQSPSGYDLALASVALQAGWTDQEVCDLLIAYRRKQGDKEKLREDYYQRTINAAHHGAISGAAAESFEALDHELSQKEARGEDADETDKRRLTASLAAHLEIPLVQVTKYVGEHGQTAAAIYRFEGPNGTGVQIGESAQVTQVTIRAKVLEAWDRYLPKFKDTEWNRIGMNIARAAVHVPMPYGATPAGQLEAWATSYFVTRTVYKTWAEARKEEGARYAFFDDQGRMCIFGPDFRDWLQETHHEHMSPMLMGALLRESGATSDMRAITAAKVNGQRHRSTALVWHLPPSWQLPDVLEEEPSSEPEEES